MSPAFKYSYGRLGLFAVAFALLFPLPLNILVKAMIALVFSAVASYFVLAKWRNEMGEQLSTIASKRSAEKERLRAALAGDEEAAVAGDRVAVADRGAVIESEDKSPSGDGPASSADGSSAAGSSTAGSSTGGSGASGSSTEAELPADARAEPAAEEKK